MAALTRSKHLHALRSLELYVPAYAPVLEALAGGNKRVLAGITTLGLGAEHLSAAGVAPLCAASTRFAGVRTLRVFAMDSPGFDWSTPFGPDRAENVRQLAGALAALLPALGGLERLEVLHGHERVSQAVEGPDLRMLKTPAEIQAAAFPRSMAIGLFPYRQALITAQHAVATVAGTGQATQRLKGS